MSKISCHRYASCISYKFGKWIHMADISPPDCFSSPRVKSAPKNGGNFIYPIECIILTIEGIHLPVVNDGQVLVSPYLLSYLPLGTLRFCIQILFYLIRPFNQFVRPS